MYCVNSACYERPADTKTTRGKLRTWQHSVPTWCFLWRLLRCVRLEAALLDRSLCVSSKYCESYKREDVSLCFLSPYFDVIRSIFKSNTPLYSYSRVSRDRIIAASAVEKSRFFILRYYRKCNNRSALVHKIKHWSTKGEKTGWLLSALILLEKTKWQNLNKS